MGIELKLFATLAKYLPENSKDYPIDEGETIRSLIEKLGVPEKDATLLFINSSKATLDSEVNNDDRVGIFPPVGGG